MPIACSTASTASTGPRASRRCSATGSARSKGAEADFDVAGHTDKIRIFTTRPDTLFGCTYVVLAPEHPLVDAITTPEQRAAVATYRAEIASRTDRDRTTEAADARRPACSPAPIAINPVNGADVPIWIADYVLAGYGTGAVFACPAPRRARSRLRQEVRPADHRGRERRQRRAGGLHRRRPARALRVPRRPRQRAGQAAHHRASRSHGPRSGRRAISPARLVVLAPALLGRAVPDRRARQTAR